MYTMDSASSNEHYPNYEEYSSPELCYLFDVVAERFNEAVSKQATNENSPYYVIEALDHKIYYGTTYARSYLDLITKRNYSEKFEVLVPAIMADSEVPLVEQISNNPDATFLMRTNDKNNNTVYLNITTQGFSGSKKEIVKAYKQFISGKVRKEDRVYRLAELVRDYELIPSNVSPRYKFAELLLRESGVDLSDS